MAVSVLVPTMLRTLTSGEDTVSVEAETIRGLVTSLESAYPGFGARLINASGALNRFMGFYVNGEDIRFLQDMDTPLKAGDEVSLVANVAGGKDISWQ
jgi:molybdopterin synthase sulfur carrier subunit